MNTIICFSILTVAFFSILFYIWYLTWPVAEGVVTHVDKWIQPKNDVIGPRKKRRLRYEYDWNSERCGTAGQSLFLAYAFSPKKNVGDPIRISVCQRFPGITCPWRPGFEFFVLLIWATFLVVGALVGLVEFTSVLG
ncbi:hypothetical protein SAMN04488490_1719 [Marinobacter sp. LV10R510-11A]|uniref:hypothetical protein n=1 Tax=Marinobacter sp. LV10R510-11A TaxID=1415568 RepID=UPI000BC08ABB|nr:hypothetical protein [Marinobacter sp. LV10R510-11A]SOB76048.1 hypothetical protein SAMN04488490_1719 [Marinobacter sp. LV10R510-11A]